MKNLQIEKLSDDTINKIVSGEIISDISNILKELLENSCDAGSSKIFVYIENSESCVIKVIDNGSGIYKDYLVKSCLRYNTSRICNVGDLSNIKTYGFRGESLFAISMISSLELISKPLSQDVAWKVSLDRVSRKYFLEPSVGNDGTIAIVRDLHPELFTNVSLGDVKGTFSKLYSAFKCIALSNFNVHFVLFKNGKEYVNLPVCLDYASQARRIELLVGRSFLNDSVDFNIEEHGINISGFITASSIKSRAPGFKFFFINNRCIDDKFINAFFSNISYSFIKSKIIFNYCLYLRLDPTLIDVNLNPKKTEVKFKHAKVLYDFLFKHVSQACLKTKKIFSYENEKLKILHEEPVVLSDYFSMNKLLFSDEFYESHDKILTVLDNKFLFFELDKKVFFVSLRKLRDKTILNSCIDQFLKYGVLSSERVFIYKFLNFKRSESLFKYKNFFSLYGFFFESFCDGSVLIHGVPKVLYNALVNWSMLLSDLVCFLDRSFVSHFSINRFDMDVINIFFKHIYRDSPFYKFEVEYFYNELVLISEQDRRWFDKNCFEVSCNKADKFD